MSRSQNRQDEAFRKVIKRICEATTHANASKLLGVPLWTMRNWLYGRNTPSPHFQKLIMAQIKEVISRAKYC
jgi:hypothetical protein